MICSLLIMMMFFVNGLVNAEQKVKHSGSILREEEMNPKTKAWWLMVESGKMDQEELKRITPKSIFIAPLLSNRAAKCQEGYSHNHLGECVKIIKIDPRAQLELLLKRLNMLYGEKKRENGAAVADEEEEAKERPAQSSNEPLHISIPILNESDKGARLKEENVQAEGTPASASKDAENFSEIPPYKFCFNVSDLFNRTNITKEIESSGSGPVNETEPCEISLAEGSGFSSGSTPPDEDEETTEAVTVLSEEIEYFDWKDEESTTPKPGSTTPETQWTGEIEIDTATKMDSSTMVDICSTTITPDSAETSTDESYLSVTNVPSVIDGVGVTKNSEAHKSTSDSDKIHFPSDDDSRTRINPQFDVSYIRFPDDSSRERPSYQSPSSFPKWNSQYEIHPSAIPRQQFWWLPDNWKVDENQQKSPLVKFWSRMPLIHDISYSENHGEDGPKPFPGRQPQLQLVNSLRRSHDFPVNFNHQPRATRRGKPFRTNRFQDSVAVPRQTFRIQR